MSKRAHLLLSLSLACGLVFAACGGGRNGTGAAGKGGGGGIAGGGAGSGGRAGTNGGGTGGASAGGTGGGTAGSSAGGAGGTSAGGTGGAGGTSAGGTGGRGGASGGGTGGAGGTGAGGTGGTGAGGTGGTGAGGTGGASDGGPTDGATDAFIGPITPVSSFGCFARSGDGNDYFPDGTAAVIVTNSPWRAPCDLAWVGLDPNGYTKPTTPTTETLTRRFVIDSLISDRATLTVSFEVDDAAEIVLNGKLIASCTPPDSNAGECQQSCHVVTLSKDDLKPVGQQNVLEMKMVNLHNVPTAGGTGYTGISYAICAAGE